MTRRSRADGAALVVAVPARNEADLITGCLHSVVRALAQARRSGVAGRVVVAVAAHRCSDATARLAAEVLGGSLPASCADAGTDGPTWAWEVVVDEEPGPVGAVRDRLVRRALGHVAVAGRSGAWLLSTDADSRVPADWVTGLLSAAGVGGIGEALPADAVAGLVGVHRWAADPRARLAYDAIVRAGLEGLDVGRHDHAYAANLAVRLTSYLDVGGFPHLPHGEDRGLLDALLAGGHRVVTPRAPVVATSGRSPGRAAGGLGALLARLADAVPVAAASPATPAG